MTFFTCRIRPNHYTGNNLCKWFGQRKLKGKVKDGKRDGKWTWWYLNGQIWTETNYKDGKKDGKWTIWHENGQIRIEANYKDGVCISGDCYN